jgi:hypothetical protein
VIAGVELDAKSPGVRNGGVGIKNDNGKLTFNACGIQDVKDAAAALSPFVGNNVQCDGQVNASVKGTVSVAGQGGFDVSINEVAATVTGTGAKLSSDKLNLMLPPGVSTTLKGQKIDVKIDGRKA